MIASSVFRFWVSVSIRVVIANFIDCTNLPEDIQSFSYLGISSVLLMVLIWIIVLLTYMKERYITFGTKQYTYLIQPIEETY